MEVSYIHKVCVDVIARLLVSVGRCWQTHSAVVICGIQWVWVVHLNVDWNFQNCIAASLTHRPGCCCICFWSCCLGGWSRLWSFPCPPCRSAPPENTRVWVCEYMKFYGLQYSFWGFFINKISEELDRSVLFWFIQHCLETYSSTKEQEFCAIVTNVTMRCYQ